MTALFPVNPRYKLRSIVGMGGMGVVYVAYDRLMQHEVALKRVQTVSGGQTMTPEIQRVHLAQEFKVLSALRHPNIIHVLDYGFDDQQSPYFTMELLQSPQTILEASASKSLAIKYDFIMQLMQAIQYLHRHGILHRDLKPSNILVVEGRVKVLDFGLAVKRNEQSSTAGTIGYMAPETLQENRASELSDLYAIAVIAYEILAEAPMFRNLNVAQMIAHIIGVIPNIEDIPVPASIKAILNLALQKKPKDRYATVTAFLHEFHVASQSSLDLETPDIRESFLQAARFVGRRDEMSLLSNALQDVFDKHKGSGWLITGESGVGKSRLVGEIRVQALVRGAWVLDGHAVGNGKQPYQLWIEPLRTLAVLSGLTDEEARVLRWIVNNLDDVLDRRLAPYEATDTRSAREELFKTVLLLFQRLTKPTLLILEDIQWATDDSIQLLARIAELAPTIPLLVMTNYRDDEFLYPSQSLKHLRLLHLQRFQETEIYALSEAMLGKTNPRLVEFLRKQTEGNVFFLVEIIRALSERYGDMEHIDSDHLPEDILTLGIQRVAHYRLNLIPSDSKPLLRLAALMGRYLDLAILQLLAPETEIDLWLSDCSYYVLDIENNRWRFMHDKVRETLIADISLEERKAQHRYIATTIEQAYGTSVNWLAFLAYHWAQADQPIKEATYALAAAKHAQSIFAFANARQYYLQALHAYSHLLNDSQHNQGLLETLTGLVTVSLLTGDPRDNLSYLSLAEDVIVSQDELPDRMQMHSLMVLFGVAGQAHYYGSEYPHAIKRFEQMASIAQKIGEHDQIVIAEAYKAQVLALQGYYKEALPYFERLLPIAQRLKMRQEWLWTKSYICFCYGMVGRYNEAMTHGTDAIFQAREMRYSTAEAVARIFLIITHWQAREIPLALRECQLTLEIAQATQDYLPLYLGYGLQARVLLESGQLRHAQESMVTCQELSKRMGDNLILADWLMALNAELALEHQDYATAQHLADDALQFAQNIESIFGQAIAHQLLGKVYQLMGDIEESGQHYIASLNAYTQCNTLRQISDVQAELLKLA
jgi:tRNA A-37 threonylcarbamoyl transferase component Bud32/DNA-binding NarL/FixJ family response regulator